MTPDEQVAALQAEISRLDPDAQAMARNFAQSLHDMNQQLRAVVLGAALASAKNAAAREQNP